MNQKKFKFSVIIPIYNVYDYLRETIESVVNQTIGFEKNVQLILVNDGSPDNSESICLEYKEKYPNNIVYIKQKNGGVSSARNKGMEYIEGEFVNFLDSDDLWSTDTFETIYKAYKQNKSIRLFSCRMHFFDAKKGNHPLNYKYKKNKIINILKDYEYPQLSASSIFIHSSVLKNHKFNREIKFSEDNLFINEILLEQEKYMVLKKPIYYYRRRSTKQSAIQTQTENINWYNVTPKKVYEYLKELSIQKYGIVIKYIQFLLMYEINWRVSVPLWEKLNLKEQKEYIKTIKQLIESIDDEIILAAKNASFAQKIYIFSLKYQIQPNELFFTKNNNFFVKNNKISANDLDILLIDRVYIKENILYLYGKLDNSYIEKEDLKVILNDKEIDFEYYELTNNTNVETFNHDFIHSYTGIYLKINVDLFNLEFRYKGIPIIPNFKNQNILFEKLPNSYRRNGHFLITYDKKRQKIKSIKNNALKRLLFELKNSLYLIRDHKYKLTLLRFLISIGNLCKFKKIMLISDRIDKADDNGEHFFKYMVNYHHEYNCYFVLSKKSPDYPRLKSIGKVLDNRSKKYKLLFLISDYIVSSQAENYVTNVLGKSNNYIQDKTKFKFVFLQHGIIKDDLSPWLNINTKRVDMFVTSSQDEYNSLLNCKYYYGKNIVKLTGLPRFDNLYKMQKNYKIQKKILVSFTWRNSLSSEIDNKTGKRLYNPQFKNSEYFKNINELLNNKKLLATLEKYGYKIRFCPHPNVQIQINDFQNNKYVEFVTGEISYQKEFCQNAMMVTDFSSVFFDFAYLKKAVVYMQCDRDDFFAGQLYDEGYFDYNKMGFGPVCENVETTVNSIIKLIKNNCQMEEKYLHRVNNFYTFNDDKNCERVLNEIEKL